MEGRCVEKASCTTCHGTREEEEEEVPSGALVHLGPADPSDALLMAHRQRSLKRSQRRENHGGNRENDGLRFHTALAFYHLGHC